MFSPHYSLPDDKVLAVSKLKTLNFADDKLNVTENIKPFPNKTWFLRVCNTSLMKTLGKGEMACNEQFVLFPLCFLPV